MFKGGLILALLVFAGGWLTGAFGGGSYSRTVGRPQAEVMAALERLDITAQPGAPGSTAAAAGGVQPIFRLAKFLDHMTWYVMSGDKVATAMTASFEPVDGGKRTRISTSVERGDAPDDFVSPAFRSKGLTMGLFGMALEAELDKLVAPPTADPATCQRLLDEFTDGNIAGGSLDRPGNLTQAIGGTAKTVMRLSAMEAELRRRGCPTNGNDGPFRPVHREMGPADPTGDDAPTGDNAAIGDTRSGVSFEPGKPMVDVTPK